MARDDERLVFVRFEELISVGDDDGAFVVGERTFGEVCVRTTKSAANLFETDAVAVDLVGIDADAHGGTRAAPREDLADALHLREFLGEDGVRGVVKFGGLEVRGCERKQKNRRVGGVYFVIAGLAGEVGGKLT